jgi:hypothetical protein
VTEDVVSTTLILGRFGLILVANLGHQRLPTLLQRAESIFSR